MNLIEYNGIHFELCKNNFTAKVVNSPKAVGDVIIPVSINYDFNEYQITSIGRNSFKDNWNIDSVQFPQDSKVFSFEVDSFFSSSIQSLDFPSKLESLEEGWCRGTSQLFNISISKENKNFFFLDKQHKIIFKKLDKEKKSIVFASRDIEEVTIPDSIVSISSFSFCRCENLKMIEFSEKSNIETIGDFAFSGTQIKKISIPKSVTCLNKGTFYLCEKLKDIEFSEIKSIGEFCFFCTSISKISLSNKVGQILKGSFSRCRFLKEFEIEEDSELHFIDEESFFCSSIEKIFIPKKIQKICNSTFCECNKLKKITFSKDIQLKSIGSKAFYHTLIDEISIPSSVTEICSESFCNCFELKKIEFNQNPKLHSIGVRSFSQSKLKNLLIPEKVEEIHEKSFENCKFLQNIECLSFSIEIKNFCFHLCENLIIASFPNVNVIAIANNAFESVSSDFIFFVNQSALMKFNITL